MHYFANYFALVRCAACLDLSHLEYLFVLPRSAFVRQQASMPLELMDSYALTPSPGWVCEGATSVHQVNRGQVPVRNRRRQDYT